MRGIYWRALTFKKSVIYLIKVNYTSYNYTPCNSTWTCLLSMVLKAFTLFTLSSHRAKGIDQEVNHAHSEKMSPDSARVRDRSLLRPFDVWSVVLEWCNNLTAYFCERVFVPNVWSSIGHFCQRPPSIPYLPYSKALCCAGFRMRLPQLTFQITVYFHLNFLS